MSHGPHRRRDRSEMTQAELFLALNRKEKSTGENPYQKQFLRPSLLGANDLPLADPPKPLQLAAKAVDPNYSSKPHKYLDKDYKHNNLMFVPSVPPSNAMVEPRIKPKLITANTIPMNVHLPIVTEGYVGVSPKVTEAAKLTAKFGLHRQSRYEPFDESKPFLSYSDEERHIASQIAALNMLQKIKSGEYPHAFDGLPSASTTTKSSSSASSSASSSVVSDKTELDEDGDEDSDTMQVDKPTTTTTEAPSSSPSSSSPIRSTSPFRYDFCQPSDQQYSMPSAFYGLISLANEFRSDYHCEERFRCNREKVPRVQRSMDIEILRKECLFRDGSKDVDVMTSEELIITLGAGTICITQTSAYHAYLAILEMHDSEIEAVDTLIEELNPDIKPSEIKETSDKILKWYNTYSIDSNSDPNNPNPDPNLAYTKAMNVNAATTTATRQALDDYIVNEYAKNNFFQELDSRDKDYEALAKYEEENLHSFHCENVHCHPLALSCEITIEGLPRSIQTVCDTSHNPWCTKITIWSCAKCNFDICRGCFSMEMIQGVKQKEAVVKEAKEIIDYRKEEDEKIKVCDIIERHQIGKINITR